MKSYSKWIVCAGVSIISWLGAAPLDGRAQTISTGAQQAEDKRGPFDEVIWRKAAPGKKATLWLVLTESGGYDTATRLVIKHAKASLYAARPYYKSDIQFVFFVRDGKDDRTGLCSGVTRKQMQAIAEGTGDAKKHAWSLRTLPERR
jgi:hypothetical protein